MRWFRLYDEILDDPKMFELSDKEKWIWIGTLCLANRSQNRGVLGKNWKTIRSLLHQKKETILAAFKKFEKLGMIENGNEELRIVNWSKRQFETDNVYERVKRFRNVSRNVSKTLHETVPDTDTDIIPPISPTKSRKKKADFQDGFPQFWEAYPRKDGKSAALTAWNKLKPPQELLVTMLQAIANQKDSPGWQKDGGQYIPMPSTWLNGKRWEDQGAKVKTWRDELPDL